jgi:hypothetical protein
LSSAPEFPGQPVSGRPATPAATPDAWRSTRRSVDAHRAALTELAARLHGGLPRVAGTALLAREGWLPAAPLELGAIALAWRPRAAPAAVTGTGPAAAHVLPSGPAGQPGSYAAAIAALDRPALFEDRFCYRLLGGRLAGSPQLAFGPGRYFEAVNVGHAVAHELAAAWAAAPDGGITLAGLPLRSAVADPADLPRRMALTAVSTLTLRRGPGGAASFLLHWRDPARVNHAGGMYQVMPAGIFQPVSGAPAAVRGDLSLWRCMAREFSEELLGAPEHYPAPGGVADYAGWPFFRALAAAREAGGLRVSCLGLGVDPLTLATDILTVATFDAAVFDRLFAGLVSRNAEGRLVTEGGSAQIPFTAAAVDRLTGAAVPMQPAGAALLRLAWRHRRALLG